MKPARSPRFQSAAERVSIATISRGGSPIVTGGALQPVAKRIMHHAPRSPLGRTTHLFKFKTGPNVRSSMADATPLWETTVYGPVRAGARIMKLDPGPMEKVNDVRYDVDRLGVEC